MTEKEKQVLLKDLCGRLPHNVKGLVTFHIGVSQNEECVRVITGKIYDRFANLQESWYENIPYIKPYLRPISSITQEETNKVFDILGIDTDHGDHLTAILGDSPTLYTVTGRRLDTIADALDYLNSIHIDYRGLIRKGLALEATDDIYKK